MARRRDSATHCPAGKLFTAALVGVALQRGLLELDVPIAQYGVRPRGEWGPWFPRVTLRHLLGMTSGVGTYAPGSTFTYDSGVYIQVTPACARRAKRPPARSRGTKAPLSSGAVAGQARAARPAWLKCSNPAALP